MSTTRAPLPRASAQDENVVTLLGAMAELSTKALYALERSDLEGMLAALSDRETIIAELEPLLHRLGATHLQVDRGPDAFGADFTRARRSLEDADARLQAAIEKQRDGISAEIAQLKAKSGRERQFLRHAGSSHTLSTRG